MYVQEYMKLLTMNELRFRCVAGRRRYFDTANAAMNITQNATARLSSFHPSFRTANGVGFWMK
jgi:hypothetical protein